MLKLFFFGHCSKRKSSCLGLTTDLIKTIKLLNLVKIVKSYISFNVYWRVMVMRWWFNYSIWLMLMNVKGIKWKRKRNNNCDFLNCLEFWSLFVDLLKCFDGIIVDLNCFSLLSLSYGVKLYICIYLCILCWSEMILTSKILPMSYIWLLTLPQHLQLVKTPSQMSKSGKFNSSQNWTLLKHVKVKPHSLTCRFVKW